MIKVSEEFAVGKHHIGWLDSDFTYAFAGKEFEEVSKFPIFHTLPEDKKDTEIESHPDHRMSVLGDLLAFLKNPPAVSKDGYSNLFYFPKVVVSVRWGSMLGYWYVYAWRRGGGAWYAGNRVFSQATDSSSVSTSSLPSETGSFPMEASWEAEINILREILTEVKAIRKEAKNKTKKK